MVYISVAPPTVGTGQNVIITFWCDKLPPTALGEYGDRFYFDVNIIKPDGTNDTITNIESDPVGAGYTNYVPTDTGTYIIQAIMQSTLSMVVLAEVQFLPKVLVGGLQVNLSPGIESNRCCL